MSINNVLAEAYRIAAKQHSRTDGWTWDFGVDVWDAVRAAERADCMHVHRQGRDGVHYRGVPVVFARSEGWALCTPSGIVTADMVEACQLESAPAPQIDWEVRERAIF